MEIYATVLEIIKNGETKPTRIMYGAKMSWKPLSRVLQELVTKELVQSVEHTSVERKKIIYTITEKGDKILTFLKDELI